MTYLFSQNTVLKTLTTLSLATVASSALAADWTPYLQGMQENCHGDKITAILTKQSAVPNALKKDVVKYKNIDEFTSKGVLQLKNATAFGYPISKITLDDELNNQYLTVHFKNNDFMALLPSFYAKLDNIKIPAGKKFAYVKQTYPNETAKITKIDYKNISHLDLIQDPSYADRNWAMLYASTPDGWYGEDYEESFNTTLSFNPKAKTIACHYNYP